MTIKAFMEKYDLPKSVVYEASCYVDPHPTIVRERDYDEQELFDAVHYVYYSKTKKLLRKAKKLNCQRLELNRKRKEVLNNENCT